MQYSESRRKPRWWQVLLQGILPSIIVFLLVWGAGKITTMDKNIDLALHKLTDLDEKIDEHKQITEAHMKSNSNLHHRRGMTTPCNGCHSD